jgi:2-polyprenyl-3-methyl-5-hydroxy-6-metoxy-1,4-benzoquinol methylase
MFLLSTAADKMFKLALRSKHYRFSLYKAAIEHRLRHSRWGRFALSKLNVYMSLNHQTHAEFMLVANTKNYQQAFWQSDLGFSWFNNSIHNDNVYFNYALQQIAASQLKTVLDVGCGWGAFCALAATVPGVESVLGIDISEKIIHEAVIRHKHQQLHYRVNEIFDITQPYDVITVFGSIDYINPNQLQAFLEHVYDLAQKQIIIVNSLRGISIEEARNLEGSVEIKRYDIGYVQPLFSFFNNKKYEHIKFQKMGQDSQIIHLVK